MADSVFLIDDGSKEVDDESSTWCDNIILQFIIHCVDEERNLKGRHKGLLVVASSYQHFNNNFELHFEMDYWTIQNYLKILLKLLRSLNNNVSIRNVLSHHINGWPKLTKKSSKTGLLI